MTVYKFQYIYTDGSMKYKYFTTKEAGIMWAHNEGDHLLEYFYEEIYAQTS